MRCSHGACPEGRGLGIIRNWSRAVQPLLTTLAMLVVLTGNTSRVEASAMTWHADLDAASQASALSQKPVLVIFTAAWSPACESFVGSTLPTAEVGAILEACFEPVRLDVDAAASIAKQYGVAHLPTACVLDASGKLLARFECPEQSADFVRLSASAIRETTVMAATASAPAEAATQVSHEPAANDPELIPGSPEPQSSSPPAVVARDIPAQPMTTAEDRQLASAFTNRATQPSAIVSEPAASVFTASQDGVPPQTPVCPSGSPLDHASGGQTTTPRGSAFASRGTVTESAAPASSGFGASGIEQRPFVEPTPSQPTAQQPAPPASAWLDTPTIARAEPHAGATAPGVPGASVATYSGFPAYTDAPTASSAQPQTPPASSATTDQTASTGQEPATQTVKENPLISFFRKPFAGFESWTARPGSNTKDQQPSIVKPAEKAVAASPTTGDQLESKNAMPLGLEGYCPVTLREKSAWIEGRPQYGACHRGRTYLFAGETEQKTFLADPDRYAPALSGDDPVMAFDAARQIPGQRQFGVTYQSRVYLFSSPQTQAVFTASPDRYVGRVMVAENPSSSGTTLR